MQSSGTIVGAGLSKLEYLAIFDCSQINIMCALTIDNLIDCICE